MAVAENHRMGEGGRKGMEVFEYVMQFADRDFVVGGRAQQAIKSMKHRSLWHYGGETYADLQRIICGDRRVNDANEYVIKQYREVEHLVRV